MSDFQNNDPLIIGGVELHSRLFIGTGKYSNDALIPDVCASSGAQVITVAMRRVDKGGTGVMGHIPSSMRLLPNTSGARNAEEAVRLARLARAAGCGNWIKIEVISDTRHLLPDGYETRVGERGARLSGGQKQRIAIAGVIAMEPRCIVLDEPTAMLDPKGRQEVMETIRKLNRDYGITILLITHYMEEVIHADHVYVMDKGSVKMQGTPKEIFSQVEKLKELRLSVPQVTLLFCRSDRASPSAHLR